MELTQPQSASHRIASRRSGSRQVDSFADYCLRVAHVMRNYGMQTLAEAPPDSRPRHAWHQVSGVSSFASACWALSNAGSSASACI